ncbi:hypothetical protein BDY21DRAFT_347478 [Lineolata rhizophorae]|uniref:VLRF1 domain-containing protein n=1 Tax=Lineolata rhizophorae TaxID=578093 RepID=A0A6A6NZ50_9PEZI|nr:hypothetical protein BDY21DRAFT_347478 [Lineolata rhizophorae]
MPPKPEEELLQRPLYVFDLPEELLLTLNLKEQTSQSPETDKNEERKKSPSPSPERTSTPEGGPAIATSCALCGLSFPNLEEQRGHVRSDLHGYNLKQKIKGLKPVSEADFERLVGELDESLSGSDSSETDSEEEVEEGSNKAKDTTLTALLKRQAKIVAPEDDDFVPKKRRRGPGKPPLLWFASSLLPKNVSLGIYRAIFSDAEQETEGKIVETIRNKQLPPMPPPGKPVQDGSGGVKLPDAKQSPHYLLCMIGGGHFAGMVVSLAPKIGKRHTGPTEERSASVLAHKTFHRYTTRRKQGGSQATNDAKGAAHSAGASLRRYNEAALTADVRQLLAEWRDLIDMAEMLFIRASGSQNRRTLFGPYDGQVLRSNDPRIRGFPFSTRRATQLELMRAFVELTRVKINRVDETSNAVAAAAAAAGPSTPPKAATPSKPVKSTLSREDEAAALHTTQLTALIRRSKAPALLSYLSSNALSPDFRFFPPDAPAHHHAPTPLHLAAASNAPAVVLALLTKARADPMVRNGKDQTPFEVAGDRATRDAFRVARGELGEEAADWETAGVPAALSKAEAERRDEAEKRDAGEKEKERKKAEVERLRKEEQEREASRREARVGKGKLLGKAATERSAQERREEETRGMSEEARRRLEREQRARAVERRLGL